MSAIVQPMKTCADCKKRKPWSEFWAKRKWEDGTTRQPHAYCKPCHQERTNRWEREKRAADPEWAKARGRRNRECIKADTDQYASSLSYRRDWARARYGYVRDLRKPVEPASREALPAGPFVAWLESLARRECLDVRAVAGRLGIGEKTVRRLLREGQATVELVTVETALGCEGSRALGDLYG